MFLHNTMMNRIVCYFHMMLNFVILKDDDTKGIIPRLVSTGL
jgi:hypothetical protein